MIHGAKFFYWFPNALVVLLHHLPPHRPNDGAGGFVGIGAAVLDLTVGDILGDRVGEFVGSNTGLLVVAVVEDDAKMTVGGALGLGKITVVEGDSVDSVT